MQSSAFPGGRVAMTREFTRRLPPLVFGCLLLAAATVSAQLAARPPDEWIKTLESPNRITSLKIPEVISALKLQPGETVADIGAGTGLFTMPMAAAVGAKGRVFAIDIEPRLVAFVTQKANDQRMANITGVVSTPDDP